MPNLIPLTADIPSYPTRAASRTTVRNRRQALRKMLWPFAKASVILLGVFVREVFL